MQIQKSYMAKKEDCPKKWYLIDAENQILGRLAVKIATILMGKHRAIYTPHVDTGDFVIIVNADKIKITGKKYQDKKYYAWSGYPGGLKSENFATLHRKNPRKVVNLAVRRMLPKTRLGRQMLKKLKVYAGAEHPHAAQCPEQWQDPQSN